MMRTTAILCSCCLAFSSMGQSELLQWVVPTLGIPSTYKEQLHVDPDGTFYLTGRYNSGNIIGDTVLAGIYNAFAAKYHSDGQLIWAACSAHEGSGGAQPLGTGITSTSNGEVVICGMTSHMTSFPPYAYYDPNTHAFITKYSANGDVLWADFPHGNGNMWIYDVDAGPNDELYVLGTCDTSLVFGGEEFHFDDGVFYHCFLARLDADGEVMWLIGGDSDGNPSMHVAGNGDVILAGHFNWHVQWGDFGADSNGSFIDLYVVRIDPIGEVLWLSTFGGNGSDYQYHITFDAYDHSYFLADLAPSLQFNGAPLPEAPVGDGSVVRVDGFGQLDTIVHLEIAQAGYYPEQMTWDPSGVLSICGEPDANDDDYYCVQRNSFTMQEIGTRYFPSHPVPMWTDTDQLGNLYTFGWAYGPFQICDTSFTNPNMVNGCGFLDKFTWYDPSTLSSGAIEDPSRSPYPNPTTGTVILPTAGFENVRIVSLGGAEVLSTSVAGQDDLLDLGTLPPGAYIAILSGVRGQVRYKLIRTSR